MTHEYVIGLAGKLGAAGGATPVPTAIAWAADRILAVGSDAAVRSISRGDSIFLDLAGCRVTPLPDRLVPANADPGDGLVVPDAATLDRRLEPGDPADLAFWRPAPGDAGPADPGRWRLVAVVRAGAFTSGEPHHGPFAEAPAEPASAGATGRPG